MPPAHSPLTSPAARIVAGARRHFLRHGFRGVTMDDLAAELGMSKKTLYAHFARKADLLVAVVDAKFDEVDAELAALTGDAGKNFPERLHGLMGCIRRHTDEIQPAFLRDVAREAPELFQHARRRRRELIHRSFGALLREGRKAGMIRRDTPVEFLVEAVLALVDSIVTPDKLAELSLTPREAFTEIITLFLEGARTEKGRGKS